MDLGTEVNNTVMTSLGFFLHSTSQVWDWKIQKPQKGNKNRPKKKKATKPLFFLPRAPGNQSAKKPETS